MAGFEHVPAIVRPHGDAESLELALIENMAREDLNPVEEAHACALLVEELGLSREDVGRRVGRSRVAVSNLLRLLDLPDEVLDLLTEGDLTEGHGRALLTASDHADRRRLARAAAVEGWTVRRTEAAAREANLADEIKPPRKAPSAACIRTRPRQRSGSATPWAGRSAPTCRCRPGATATASRLPSSPSTKRWPSPSASAPSSRPDRLPNCLSRAPDRAPGARYHRAAGAISSVG